MEKTKYKLPKKIHCPVCGEKMLFLPLKINEAQGAASTGALLAAKMTCSCGTNGVLTLRKTPDSLHLYSLSFWIKPEATIKKNVLSKAESNLWNLKIKVDN